ncbi:hypothetical protein [Mycobacterium kyorinense]|uniref:hypothetical protein n=1 Tax=Mycobacterium kyorinense TaxID=487514 RepID=UPI000694B5D0|nr:hypothetical protein [Mycobacterium kyorinense]
MNPIERAARGFDGWQQRHPVVGFPIAVVKKFSDDQAGYHVSLLAYYSFVAAFPLLLALTAIAGVVLRSHPKLQEHLVNSAFAEFPIVGGQIHQQLGVANFGNSLSLTIGILGSLYGARGSRIPYRTRSIRCGPFPRSTGPDSRTGMCARSGRCC